MDLFVMMVSIGLSSRFKQINEDLQRIKGQVIKNLCDLKFDIELMNVYENQNFQHMSNDFWALRRTQYRKLAGLCMTVDNAISQITLLAISNNLFFISVQLLRSIR